MLRSRQLRLLSVALGLWVLGAPSWPSEVPSMAFVGFDLLAPDGGSVLEGQTVVTVGERIAAVGPKAEVPVPADAQVIEGEGRFLLPGLIDAHIHLRKAEPAALLDYLRSGITTAREMNGRPFLLEWRDQIESGELQGPTLVVAAPTLGNFSSPRDGYPTPESAEQAKEIVRSFHQAGYDWIKVYSFLGAEAFEGVMAEAKRLGIPVGGHVPFRVGLEPTLRSGIRSIEHLTEYVGSILTEEARVLDESDFRSVFGAGEIDPEGLDRVVEATLEAGVWNVPSLIWFDRNLPTSMAEKAWSDPSLRAQAERNRRRIVGRLHEQGALLALGSDSDNGDDLPIEAIYDEIAAMVEAGLEAHAALRASTLGGATLLGIEEEVGTIEVGKRADLVVLACSPLEAIDCVSKVEVVMARGRLVPAAD